jgi:hypothetical protein
MKEIYEITQIAAIPIVMEQKKEQPKNLYILFFIFWI